MQPELLYSGLFATAEKTTIIYPLKKIPLQQEANIIRNSMGQAHLATNAAYRTPASPTIDMEDTCTNTSSPRASQVPVDLPSQLFRR
jgi:hypothetical protein